MCANDAEDNAITNDFSPSKTHSLHGGGPILGGLLPLVHYAPEFYTRRISKIKLRDHSCLDFSEWKVIPSPNSTQALRNRVWDILYVIERSPCIDRETHNLLK